MRARNLHRGRRVRVTRHFGAQGSTGRVSGLPIRCGGHAYYPVRLTGGRGRGLTLRFTANELEPA